VRSWSSTLPKELRAPVNLLRKGRAESMAPVLATRRQRDGVAGSEAVMIAIDGS
jgi:hypothetical protein